MTEYIERDAALNLVCTTTMDNVADAPMFLRLIKGLPAADVAPVVRCQACEHLWVCIDGTHRCHRFNIDVNPRTFYCAFGRDRGAHMDERSDEK